MSVNDDKKEDGEMGDFETKQMIVLLSLEKKIKEQAKTIQRLEQLTDFLNENLKENIAKSARVVTSLLNKIPDDDPVKSRINKDKNYLFCKEHISQDPE